MTNNNVICIEYRFLNDIIITIVTHHLIASMIFQYRATLFLSDIPSTRFPYLTSNSDDFYDFMSFWVLRAR